MPQVDGISGEGGAGSTPLLGPKIGESEVETHRDISRSSLLNNNLGQVLRSYPNDSHSYLNPLPQPHSLSFRSGQRALTPWKKTNMTLRGKVVTSGALCKASAAASWVTKEATALSAPGATFQKKERLSNWIQQKKQGGTF